MFVPTGSFPDCRVWNYGLVDISYVIDTMVSRRSVMLEFDCSGVFTHIMFGHFDANLYT